MVMRSVLENVLEQCAKDIRIGIFREHLQKAILRSMHRAWGSPSLSFLGGACLRIAHGIGRFSEDLDFSQNDNEFDVNKLLHKVEKLLSKEGYICQIKHRNSKTAVKKAEIQFPGLLHEVGLSPHKSQNFRIKFEVDTNPPAHGQSERVSANSFVAPEGELLLWCHDLPSLMAGKLAAVFTRPWAKGRDMFDLDWFLREKPGVEPNFKMLNASLAQSLWEGPELTPLNWHQIVEKKVHTFDDDVVTNDLQAFVIPSDHQRSITKQSISAAIRKAMVNRS